MTSSFASVTFIYTASFSTLIKTKAQSATNKGKKQFYPSLNVHPMDYLILRKDNAEKNGRLLFLKAS